ncbi:MAG: extracellular solute-binding protein [Lachnospiraceae bacterium]|nr:extracellular solute-binding protein [Lachnospiraceae bacterium]
MKKKVLKRMFSVLLAGTMMATVLAGCGNDGGNTGSGDSQQSSQNEFSAQPSDDTSSAEGESQAEGQGQSDEWIADREIVLHAYVDDIYNALPDDQVNNPVFKEIKERTGIQLKVTFTPGESNSKTLAAQLAAGTIPDAIVCYLNNSARPEFPLLHKAAKDGLFADLSEYIPNSKVYSKYMEEGYLPNDSYKNIVFREDFDGAVYLLHLGVDAVDRSMIYDPQEAYIGGPYIQKSIIDALQIDPTSVRTSEDFYNLLVKIKEGGFKDDNGNDVIPLGPKYWGGSVDAMDWDFRSLMWGVSDNYNMDADGQIYHFAETEYVYDLINYVRKLLAEGLLHQEYFTMDETRADELYRNHSCAIMGDVHNYVDIVYESEDWIPLGPLNDIQGNNKMVTSGKGARGCLAISDEAENPEEIFRFFDWLSTYEGQLLGQYGIEGLSYNMVDGMPQLTEEALDHLNKGDEKWMWNEVGAAFGGSGVYLFEFITTDKNNIDYFGEARPGAAGGSTFQRSVDLATQYPREYKLVEGLAATSYLNSDDMAEIKAQLSLLNFDDVLVQAIFAKDDAEVKSIIESFRAQLKSSGNDQFKEKLMEIYNEDPKAINFYR